VSPASALQDFGPLQCFRHTKLNRVFKMFIKGITIGLSIAAPVGPIGLLCIRRALTQGVLAGLVTGLGAATADALYGCIAGFGLTAISNFLMRQKLWLEFAGGVFLCYLGVRILTAKPKDDWSDARTVRLLPAYGSTLVLTLTNPLTILSFAAVFAGLGLGTTTKGDYAAASRLVAGVFAGSALWWLLLSGGVGLIRVKMGSPVLSWVNRVSGCTIFGFGLYALSRLFLG
jgi:threonine/homoserine/homoserine lactone efflux protein